MQEWINIAVGIIIVFIGVGGTFEAMRRRVMALEKDVREIDVILKERGKLLAQHSDFIARMDERFKIISDSIVELKKSNSERHAQLFGKLEAIQRELSRKVDRNGGIAR